MEFWWMMYDTVVGSIGDWWREPREMWDLLTKWEDRSV